MANCPEFLIEGWVWVIDCKSQTYFEEELRTTSVKSAEECVDIIDTTHIQQILKKNYDFPSLQSHGSRDI